MYITSSEKNYYERPLFLKQKIFTCMISRSENRQWNKIIKIFTEVVRNQETLYLIYVCGYI